MFGFLTEAGLTAIMSDRPDSEFEVPPNKDSIEACLENVRKCDSMVVVLSQRYGPSLGIVGYEDVSATHLEYLEALKMKKPVHLFIRDRLEAEFAVWDENPVGRESLKLRWCKEPKDRRLFELIKAHRQLVKDSPTSNWFWIFRDFTDIKGRLRKEFKLAIGGADEKRLIENGRMPFLELEGRVHSDDRAFIYLEMRLRNVGGGAALNPMVGMYRGTFQQRFSSLAANNSQEFRVKLFDYKMKHRRVPTQILYSTVEGYEFQDRGELQVVYDYQNPASTSVTYLRTDHRRA